METTRRTVTRIAGGLFAIATAIIVWMLALDAASSGTASVLLGALDGQSVLSLAMLVAVSALCVGLLGVAPPRWMLPLKIVGAVLAACAAAVAMLDVVLTVEANVTAVLSDGCDTGYVVVERSFLLGGNSTVYRMDGPLTIVRVGRASGDDGYQPFSTGGYAVTADGDTLTIHYSVDRPSEDTDLTAAGYPTLVLPALPGPHQCGLTGPRDLFPAPPSTSPRAPITAESIDEGLRELLTASIDASAGAVLDASGAPIDVSGLTPVIAACADTAGIQKELSIDFRTEDNARSLARILEVWDAAGYDRDRAMQEDIRYSETLPIERMSIRDRSSIDGMLHMTITSACVPGE
jgi:hypothetical protein